MDDLVIKASKHQLALQSRRVAYHRGKVGGKSLPFSSPAAPSSVVCSNMAASVADDGSLSASPSHPSHTPSPSSASVADADPQPQLSQVLKVVDKIASFLGLTEDDSPACLRDAVKGMVRDSLTDELSNLISAPSPPPPTTDVPLFVVGGVVM